jgi:hypothetical protein
MGDNIGRLGPFLLWPPFSFVQGSGVEGVGPQQHLSSFFTLYNTQSFFFFFFSSVVPVVSIKKGIYIVYTLLLLLLVVPYYRKRVCDPVSLTRVEANPLTPHFSDSMCFSPLPPCTGERESGVSSSIKVRK